jgi:hypothetical protein
MQALESNPVTGPVEVTQLVAKPVKSYQYSLENLRGLSILFVMLTHISSFAALGVVGRYLEFLFGDATTWFVFISGYLFNYIEQRKFKYFEYLKKKAKFVILPYLILSIIAIGAGIYFKRHLIMGLSPWAYIAWSLLVGGSVITPMWFIPMISIFFLLSPLFYRLGGSYLQYIVLLITLGISLVTSRPIEDLNPFLTFVHFAGFYVFGLVVSANVDVISRIRNTSIATLLIVGAVFLFLIASSSMPLVSGDYPGGFMEGLGKFNNMQFGKLTLLVAVFLLFDRFLNVPNAVLKWTAQVSFGLFFMQGFFMAAFAKLIQIFVFPSPLLALGAELVWVLGGSMVAVVLAKALLGKWSRYVIGC